MYNSSLLTSESSFFTLDLFQIVLTTPNEEGITIDLIDIRGFTRSKKCYTSKEVEKKRKKKVKERKELGRICRIVSSKVSKKKLIIEEEAKEFLKQVKQSEYSIVE